MAVIDHSWPSQACSRHCPTLNAPRRNYQTGHQSPHILHDWMSANLPDATCTRRMALWLQGLHEAIIRLAPAGQLSEMTYPGSILPWKHPYSCPRPCMQVIMMLILSSQECHSFLVWYTRRFWCTYACAFSGQSLCSTPSCGVVLACPS